MQRTTEERFWGKVNRRGPNECWEWQAGKDKDGYGKFSISRKTIPSHRFSYELHKGEIPEGLFVLHSCDNPCCVNPNHLRVGTVLDNAKDREARGRGVYHKGENNCRAKLSELEVKAIIELLRRYSEPKRKGPKSGINNFLSRWFGVPHSTISYINTGRYWKHLDRGAA